MGNLLWERIGSVEVSGYVEHALPLTMASLHHYYN